MKQKLGIDHNVSPREDLNKYGEKAVQSGKITAAQLRMLRRMESAHANAVEHFPFFVTQLEVDFGSFSEIHKIYEKIYIQT